MAKSTAAKSATASRVRGAVQSMATGFADMSLGDKITWAALHVMLFLVPLAISNLTMLGIGGGIPLTYDQFDIIKLVILRACTIVALAAWAAQMLLAGGRVRLSKIHWIVLGLLVWVGITTITSIHPPTAFFGKYRRFEGFLSFVNYAVIYFLVVQMVDRPGRMRSLVRTLFASGVFVMLYGALQYVGVEPVPYGKLPFETNRSFSTYGNPDLLGGFIVLMLPLAIALALSEDSVFWRTVYWIGAMLTAAVTITAFTRSAWIGGSFAVIAIVVAAVRERYKPRVEDWAMAGVSSGVVALLIMRSLSAENEVMNVAKRVASIFQFSEGSALTRFQIWEAAINAVQARPIFGFGADTFRLVFPMYKPAAYVAAAGYLSVADNVHNYPLQIASALGIPGAIILYATFAWILIASFKSAFMAETGPARIIYAGVWAAALGYLVHLFFGLSVNGTTVLLWACFGMLIAPKSHVHEVRAPQAGVGMLSTLVVIAIASVLMVGNVVYAVADRAYLIARVSEGAFEARVAAAERAVRLNPYNDMYRAEVGLSYMDWAQATLVQAAGDPTREQQGLALFARAEQSFLDTIEFVPAEYDNYVFLAGLYNALSGFLGDTNYSQKAAEIARKGIEVEEFGPAIRVEYARALSALGKDAEALKEVEFASELDPRFAQPVALRALILQRLGKTDEGLKLLKDFAAAHGSTELIDSAIANLEASATAQ